MLRPIIATRAVARTTAVQQRRTMASSGGHASHYDPPSGWLFGQDPAAPKVKQDWENIMYYGFFGSFFVAAVAYAYKPDTNIETWALEEARRRLETEGVIPDSTKPVKITEQLKTVSGK